MKPSNRVTSVRRCSGSLACRLAHHSFIHCAALKYISVSGKTVLTFSIVVWIVQSHVVHLVYNGVIPFVEGGLFPFPPSGLPRFVRILVYFQTTDWRFWFLEWLWVCRCRRFERTYCVRLLAYLTAEEYGTIFLWNGGECRLKDKASFLRKSESSEATLWEPEKFQAIACL
jgi:hypothetical protein